ncbi:MAG: MerR family transcriptional regulator [Bacillota bacterium]
MAYTVKAVAEMAGVSVRTLHYYDEIGLLRPAKVTAAGYRLYTDADLERLQQVLFFRELGLSLREIRAILDRPDFDRREALRRHRGVLVQQQERIRRLIQTIDRTLAAMEGGEPVAGKDLFDGFDPSQYEEEARRRWGHTREYQESTERTRRYTQADWEVIKAEGKEILEGLAALLDRDPADPEVQNWIRRHHQHINSRFYTCSPEVYRGLADLYVTDERFTAFWERIRPGMAQFMRAAMHAYCDRLEGR